MGGERKNKVDERAALAIGIVSGIVCALCGAEPTGTGLVDALILFVAGFAVTWAGASASWWVVGVAAMVAVATVSNPAMIVVALMGFGLAVYIGFKKQNLPELRALAAAFTVNSLARSDLEGFLGLSMLVAVVAGLFVVLLGLQRRPSAVRATAEIGLTVVGVAAIVGVVGFAIAAGTARAPLTDGNDLAKQGLSAVNQGDFEAAAEFFEQATQAFDRADQQLTRPWGRLAQGVPVVAQHYRAATEMSGAAADATRSIVNAVRDVDVEALRVDGGRIDLNTVAGLEEPFAELSAAIASLQSAVEDSDSQWLVSLVSDELQDLQDDLERNDVRLDNALTAVQLAPQMLGADGDRHYLVLFTTPAEARGLGGFAGNYAVLRARDGRLSMPDFGRMGTLNLALADNPDARLIGPPGYVERYGDYVLNDGTDRPATYAWSNITMSPDFPDVASVAAELFPQSGGRPVDGVIVMDPFVLQTLLQYTGPIEVEGLDRRLNAENAADILLKDQYLITDNPERIDLLEDAARQTMDRILAGALPSPVTLARDLGPLAVEGRLLFWTTEALEQDLLRTTHLLGEFPTFEGGNGLGVVLTNVGGSKIDTYLQRELTVDSVYETSTGVTRTDVSLTLTNTAPASGLPEYVIGNTRGLPLGTSLLRVCVHTPLLLESATVSDDPETRFQSGVEKGLNVFCRLVTVDSQSTVTIDLELAGSLTETDRPFELWEQPLVNPLVVEIDGN